MSLDDSVIDITDRYTGRQIDRQTDRKEGNVLFNDTCMASDIW